MLRGCTAPATCSTLIFANTAGAQGSWVPVSHGFGVRGASHTGTDGTLVQLPKNKTRRVLQGRSCGSQLQSIPSFFMVRQRSLIITDVRFWKGYFRQMAFHLPSPYFFTPSLIHSLSCMVHFCFLELQFLVTLLFFSRDAGKQGRGLHFPSFGKYRPP